MASTPPSVPWRVVAMDFAGPYPVSQNGNRYVLVFTDQFTKWVELLPAPDQTALTVTRLFYERIICRFGCPLKLLSDNGPQFRSSMIEHLCHYFGIQKIFSSAYHPQGDGLAERMMRTMNNCLASCARLDPERWDHYLPGIAFAYNTAEHEGTKVSPFELNTGRVARLPGGADEVGGPRCSNDQLKYLKRLRNVITECNEHARRMVQGYWTSVKRRYDQRRRDIQLRKGEMVLVRLTDEQRLKYGSRKLAPRWSKPATVTGTLDRGVTFKVKHVDGHEELVHGERILPVRDPLWGELFPDPGLEKPAKTTTVPRTPSHPQDEDVEEDESVADAWVIQYNRPPLVPLPVALPGVITKATTRTAQADALSDVSRSPELESHISGSDLTPMSDGDVRATEFPASDRGVLFGSSSSSSSSDAATPPGHYHVDRICGQRTTRDGQRQLLIAWRGYRERTWEPRVNMEEDVPEVVADFDSRVRGLCRSRGARRASQ